MSCHNVGIVESAVALTARPRLRNVRRRADATIGRRPLVDARTGALEVFSGLHVIGVARAVRDDVAIANAFARRLVQREAAHTGVAVLIAIPRIGARRAVGRTAPVGLAHALAPVVSISANAQRLRRSTAVAQFAISLARWKACVAW